MSKNIKPKLILLALLMPVLFVSGVSLVAEKKAPVTTLRTTAIDFIDATFLPQSKEVIFVTHLGQVGYLTLSKDKISSRIVHKSSDNDFTVVKLGANQRALLGTSKGKVAEFDKGKISAYTSLSEFNEPVLDMLIDNDRTWVSGGRGLLTTKVKGKNWQPVTIDNVYQPPMVIPDTQPSKWYLGAANIDPDSLIINATVNGKALDPDDDYYLNAEEGILEIFTAMDAASNPKISYSFTPGPAFRGGDLAWNTLLKNDGKITIAGEFGMILQSDDDGKSWVKKHSNLSKTEPAYNYWLAGAAKDQQIVLVGAGGRVLQSEDNGNHWMVLPSPGKEAIFGVEINPDNTPVIAGAVGLVAEMKGKQWDILDRTAVDLLSWVKVFVPIDDDSLLLLGGRSIALLYKDGAWKRLNITIEGSDNDHKN